MLMAPKKQIVTQNSVPLKVKANNTVGGTIPQPGNDQQRAIEDTESSSLQRVNASVQPMSYSKARSFRYLPTWWRRWRSNKSDHITSRASCSRPWECRPQAGGIEASQQIALLNTLVIYTVIDHSHYSCYPVHPQSTSHYDLVLDALSNQTMIRSEACIIWSLSRSDNDTHRSKFR